MDDDLGATLAARLRAGDLAAAPAVLNLVETRTPAAQAQTALLLDGLSPAALGHEPPGHVVGVTGPPGAGKSTLLSELVRSYRRLGRSVAVLAVDPSSRRTGGSLLGDRARIHVDPNDASVFIRSTAAGDRLGGLAWATRAAAQALSAAFDVVIVETVGVGQSETDVADVADTVMVIVQPGSGDALQFLKSGIMEIPDVLVVTKADLGRIAERAKADVRSALRSIGDRSTKVVAVSSLPPATGFDDLIEVLDAHRARADVASSRRDARRRTAIDDFRLEHGERALRALGGRQAALRALAATRDDLAVPILVQQLERAAGLSGADRDPTEAGR
ncbi:putative periplasmic protein kinase ArgK and related GTPases of G3E family [Patulibacter medicamentivorans]|uniref:Putative periplasmic protein kinase ArgK and related GTPases of G3E family n=1 Tax=Patulibacter medicamentivorans TaxID=1097667 RepID=H0E4M0_9ACTN|nr:GTP-binding protein [Patulibacter medicamentivorans]EHN11391.1 putative periplasmic protein kinase ArgK and related GTPases of G3E family [Patulibacter medicamentivorans]